MRRWNVDCEGRVCPVWAMDGAKALLIQPADDGESEQMDDEIQAIAGATGVPFALAAWPVVDWNAELSPWDAPPVFGRSGFGHGAAGTLSRITGPLLTRLEESGCPGMSTVILGGYSLAGLFALWGGCETDRFRAIAAASPSVWFPGWMDHAVSHPLRTSCAYLSLGDREERTRNPVMASVGANIRRLGEQYAAQDGLTSVLEWNPGGHFQDPLLRTARAFAWCLNTCFPE